MCRLGRHSSERARSTCRIRRRPTRESHESQRGRRGTCRAGRVGCRPTVADGVARRPRTDRSPRWLGRAHSCAPCGDVAQLSHGPTIARRSSPPKWPMNTRPLISRLALTALTALPAMSGPSGVQIRFRCPPPSCTLRPMRRSTTHVTTGTCSSPNGSGGQLECSTRCWSNRRTARSARCTASGRPVWHGEQPPARSSDCCVHRRSSPARSPAGSATGPSRPSRQPSIAGSPNSSVNRWTLRRSPS